MRSNWFQNLTGLISTLLPLGKWLFAYLIVHAIAGKTTLFGAFIDVKQLEITQQIILIGLVFSIGVNVYQYVYYRLKVANFSDHNKDLMLQNEKLKNKNNKTKKRQ